MNYFVFLWRRASRHWQILLTLAIGVFFATAMLATAPILVNTVVEFGLRRTLIASDPLEGHIRLRAFDLVDTERFSALNQTVQQTVNRRLGLYSSEIVPTIGTRWLHPWVEGSALETERVNLRFYGQGETDIRARSQLVAGDWPTEWVQEVGTEDEPFVLTAVIGQPLAQAYDLTVGDQLPASVQRSAETPDIIVQVAGIIQANDPRDPYWFAEWGPLDSLSDNRWTAQYGILVSPEAFFEIAQQLFPNTTYEIGWHVVIDPNTITTPRIAGVQGDSRALISELDSLSPSVDMMTELPDIVGAFEAQATAVRAPMYFLSAEVVLLTLYYVIMVSALAVRQVEKEFAVLQSRGASPSQIFWMQGIEAFFFSVVACLSGPALATLLVRGITIAGPLADVADPAWGLTVPQSAWLAAGVGALGCIVGLLLPVNTAIKRSIVNYQQATIRDVTPPFWQRYYLDVFVLLIGLITLWRLQVTGSLVGGSGTRPQVDWLLLLAPVALLVGAGTILLRLFPPLLNGLARLVSHGRELPATLAVWQAARNPKHVARLVLLLTLSMALGILTTGINATLDTSEAERARYTTGNDIRLISRQQLPIAQMAQLDGVAEQTAVWRNEGAVRVGRSTYRYELFAIDPEAFASLTQYRRDFSAEPMDSLLERVHVAEPNAHPLLPLPAQPESFGFWLYTAPDIPEFVEQTRVLEDSDFDRMRVEGKFQTALGETLTFHLEPSETGGYPEDGWRYFSTELPALTAENYPLQLHSLWWRNRARRANTFSANMRWSYNFFVDDLTVVDRGTGESMIVNDMEDVEIAWEFGGTSAFASHSTEQARSGSRSQNIQMNLEALDWTALWVAPDVQTEPPPLPILVSPRFATTLELTMNEIVNSTTESQPMTLQVVGSVNYFPTAYEDLPAGFVVVDRDALLGLLNDRTSRAINPSEGVLSLLDGVEPTAVSSAAFNQFPAQIQQILEADTVRRNIKADPMALGLRSVTYFGYILTTTLSLIGFATYFYMSARQKSAIYGVLRSIGMSPRQLYGSLMIEQVVLVLAGLALGTLLGSVLNQITLPELPITFGERPPTPPFIAQTDWWAVGRIYLTLMVAFLLALGMATVLLWRTQLHRVLRVGEE